MTDATSDLDALFPEPLSVTTRSGETIAVAEFKFGAWPRAIRLFRPITDAVQNAGIAGLGAGGLVVAQDWLLRLPQVMDEGGEALIDFVGFAIGKPRAWFDTLDGDDGIALTKAVFEANSSFFSKKLMPALGLQLQPVASAPAAVDGATSSTSSSDTDTTEATSAA